MDRSDRLPAGEPGRRVPEAFPVTAPSRDRAVRDEQHRNPPDTAIVAGRAAQRRCQRLLPPVHDEQGGMIARQPEPRGDSVGRHQNPGSRRHALEHASDCACRTYPTAHQEDRRPDQSPQRTGDRASALMQERGDILGPDATVSPGRTGRPQPPSTRPVNDGSQRHTAQPADLPGSEMFPSHLVTEFTPNSTVRSCVFCHNLTVEGIQPRLSVRPRFSGVRRFCG